MQIKDLSFITEVTEESTNNIDGGDFNDYNSYLSSLPDPFANVGNNDFIDRQNEFMGVYSSLSSGEISQGDFNLYLLNRSFEDLYGSGF